MKLAAVDLATLSVNEVIRRYPASVEVFNRYGVDACCGGAASVTDAATRDGVDVNVLLAELELVTRSE